MLQFFKRYLRDKPPLRPKVWQLALLLAACTWTFCNPAAAQIWFTQDTTQTTSPDVQDIFVSPTTIRFLNAASNSNFVLDNPALFGLLAGDNIDALHQELRELNTKNTVYNPGFVFSVDRGAIGQPGSAVRQRAVNNAADLFETNGFFTNFLVATAQGIGVADQADVDGFKLTPFEVVDRQGFFYISLAPGSPTLAALGASSADVLACRIGGTPVVSIRAQQLGLLPSDDLDGLVMLDGRDANQDGDFFDAGDSTPLVVFSASHFSRGVAGTAFAQQQLVDFPSGGDIYSSLAVGSNALFQDSRISGLNPFDEMNGLGLSSLSVEEDEKGGGLTPSGSPFSGGASTPGAPGTPGGPALRPQLPGKASNIRVGLCKTRCSEGTCTITVTVFFAVGPPVRLTLVIKCDDGDPANGSELDQAVAQILNALRGVRDPVTGRPAFQGGGGLRRVGPNHTNGSLRVTRGVCVTGVVVNTAGCICYTQNLRGAIAPDLVPGLRLKLDFPKNSVPGLYQLQLGQFEDPYQFEIAEGDRKQTLETVASQLSELGFGFEISEGDGITIKARPDGKPPEDIWSSGYIKAGNGNIRIGICWDAVNDGK